MSYSPASVRPPLAALISALVIAAAALLMSAAPAAAHDQLVSTDPAAGATVEALPDEIALTYSAELLGDGGSNEVQVTDAAGTVISDGPAVVDGTTVTQALTGDVTGAVQVTWRVVSSDGHPISGQYAFTVAGAPPTSASPEASPTASASASSEPRMTTMATPTESPATASGDDAAAADPLPWILGAIVVLVLVAVVIALLVARSRRARGGSTTGTEG